MSVGYLNTNILVCFFLRWEVEKNKTKNLCHRIIIHYFLLGKGKDVLGIRPRASYMLDKHSPSELYPQSDLYIFKTALLPRE
jgi:hypothetical protein